MLLPETVLRQLEFYEETSGKDSSDDYMESIITLHYKQWYKFKKVIRIRWASNYNAKDQTIRHTETQDSVELRQQLREWFRPKPLPAPVDPGLEPIDRTIRRIK